jgi:hypothetical protein
MTNKWKPLMHKIQIAVGVCIVVFSAVYDYGTDIVEYLNSPPWIKEMLFVQSTYNEAGSVPGKETIKGWVNVTNRMAIQPGGMFFESLTPNPVPFTVAASPTQRVVLGISDHFIWQGNIDSSLISISSRRAQEGGSSSNPLQTLVDLRLKWDINPARFFGFPPLQPGSLKLSGDKFEALTTDDRAVKGEILDRSEGLPVRLQFALDNDLNEYTLINYKYSPNEQLPVYFDRVRIRNGHVFGLALTNWFRISNFGADSNIHGGYTPEMFFTNLNVFSTVIVESNGSRYSVTANGILRPVDERYIGPARIFDRRGSNKGLTVVILFIFLVANGCFIVIIRLRQRKARNNNN